MILHLQIWNDDFWMLNKMNVNKPEHISSLQYPKRNDFNDIINCVESKEWN